MHPLRVSARASLLVASLAACHTVAEVGYPQEFVESKGPTHVWVTRGDKSTMELWNPQVHGDTLAGFVGGRGDYYEIPLSDVKIMRATFAAPARTALVVGAGVLFTAGMFQLVTGSNFTRGNNVCYKSPTGEVIPCPDPAAPPSP